MKPDLSDVLLLLGAVCLFVGVWMIYPPAALIVAGFILVFFAALVQQAKAAATRKPATGS
jgi:hypothetical protein